MKWLSILLIFCSISCGCFRSDLNCDGIVDFQDFALFAEDWGNENMLENLIAHYKLNENSASTVVIDSSVNAVNGTSVANTSTKTTTGKVGGALTFNGTSDYVNTNQTFQSTFRDSFTISLWCKPDDGQPSAAQGFGGTRISSTQARIELFFNTDGTITGLFIDSAVGTASATSSSVFINGQETWHLISGVFERVSASTAKILLYFDGVLIKTGNVSNCDMDSYTSTKKLFLGAINNNGSATAFFAGLLDNVMLFNRALSANEIALLYNSGRGTEDFSMYPELSSDGNKLFLQVGV